MIAKSKIFTSLLLIILISLDFSSFSQNPKQNITGIWLTPENRAAIQIYKTGNCYEGKIIWEKESFDENGKPKTDIHNPDPKMRNKPLKGMVIMKNIRFKKGEEKACGTIYNAENGNTYKITVELTDNETLKIRGYVGISLIGKTSVWKRKK